MGDTDFYGMFLSQWTISEESILIYFIPHVTCAWFSPADDDDHGEGRQWAGSGVRGGRGVPAQRVDRAGAS